MKKRIPVSKHWNPITTLDGQHQGEYEVSDDTLTVRFQDRQKSARASAVPPAYAGKANESLASIILGELIREGRADG